jgi:hypothetical protein
MRNAVLLKDDLTNEPEELGIVAETAVYKHIKSFLLWRICNCGILPGGNKNNEIDIVVKSDHFPSIMLEVKYRDQAKIAESDAIVRNGEMINIQNWLLLNGLPILVNTHMGLKRFIEFLPAFLYLLGQVEKQKSIKNN